MSPAISLSFSACLLILCSGCAPELAERSPVLLAPIAALAPAERSPVLFPPIVAPGGAPSEPVATGPRVQLFVEESEGAETARVRAALAAAEPRVSECVPGTGGVLRLRVAGGPDGARFTVEPSSMVGRRSPLGARERRCVLEALSTVDVVSISADPSPSARPSGFTALLRIEW